MKSDKTEPISTDSIDPLWTSKELQNMPHRLGGRSNCRGNWFIEKLAEYAQLSVVTKRIAKELVASGGTNGVDSAVLFVGYPSKVRSRNTAYEDKRRIELALVERILHAARRVDNYGPAPDISPSEAKKAVLYLFGISAISQLSSIDSESVYRTYVEDLIEIAITEFDLL